jgi:hypothetical protein
MYELCDSGLRLGQKGVEGSVTLKIVIKGMSGAGVSLSLSKRRELVTLSECEYKVTSEKILKIKNPSLNSGKIYLTLHSPINLTLFKLRY